MMTGSDCLVCFLRQTLATARLAAQDEQSHRRVVLEIGALLTGLDPAASPPENAVQVYGRIAELTGNADPFAEVKRQSTKLALQLRDRVRQQILAAGDPFYASLRFAIAANIIDYGSQLAFDAEKTLHSCLQTPLCIDDYHRLSQLLNRVPAAEVLYLADNCGEIVFDALVIEQLEKAGCRVTLAVRGGVILNDATMADAEACELSCRVVDSGLSCPGTPINACSRELRDAFARADVIVSKGQGNFETLSETEAPLFFLLTVKCPVVGRHISDHRNRPDGTVLGRGEMILLDGRRQR